MHGNPIAHLAGALLACSIAAIAATTAAANSAAVVATSTPQQRARACATLEARYQRLEARMRAGYGARESERLWAERRALRERRWALRCQDLPGGGYAPPRGPARP